VTLWLLPLAVAALFFSLRSFVMTPPPVSKPCGRVVGVVGLRGYGKTLYCVYEARRRLLRGQKVATNFSMSFACDCRAKGEHAAHSKRCWSHREAQWQVFRGWHELLYLRDCTVVIDEVQMYAPASATFRMPIEAVTAMTNFRKFNVDLFWIAQHELRVTKALRDNTNELVQCVRRPGGHKATAWGPEDFRKPKLWIWVKKYRRTAKLGSLYDTMEIIRPDASVDAEGVVDRMLKELGVTN
jgi:hypothetical protein